MTTANAVFATVAVAVVAVPLRYESTLPPLQCVDKRVVAEIVSVAYRTSTFRDTQGNLVSLDQATYKVGSEICLKQERVK